MVCEWVHRSTLKKRPQVLQKPCRTVGAKNQVGKHCSRRRERHASCAGRCHPSLLACLDAATIPCEYHRRTVRCASTQETSRSDQPAIPAVLAPLIESSNSHTTMTISGTILGAYFTTRTATRGLSSPRRTAETHNRFMVGVSDCHISRPPTSR